MSDKEKEITFECIWCGRKIIVSLPWRGRPEGPRCACNPNSWGNWKRLHQKAKSLAKEKGIEL